MNGRFVTNLECIYEQSYMKPYELIAYFIFKMIKSCLQLFVHMQFFSHNYVDF